MEQVIDWLNENELRAYPLLDDPSKTAVYGGVSWTMPDNFLLDLQLRVPFSLKETVQLGDAVTTVSLPVFLKTLRYSQTLGVNTVDITFGTAEQDVTVFSVVDVDNLNYPYYLRQPDGCLAVLGVGILDFISTVPVDSEASPNIPTEPATCVQFNDAWLGVNSLRTNPEKNSKDPANTPLYDRFQPALPIETSDTTHSLSGDVKLLAGYNFRVDIAENLIDLEISSRYGLVMDCTTSFIPERYLDCSELVSYINGIPPDAKGSFRLAPGSNIIITPGAVLPAFDDEYTEEANTHSLFIGLTFKATDLCAPVDLIPS